MLRKLLKCYHFRLWEEAEVSGSIFTLVAVGYFRFSVTSAYFG